MSDREEIEHVPWSELMEESDERRRRALYLAAGLIGAVVLGVILARAWWAPSTPAAVPVETGPVTSAGETAVAAPTTSVPELPLYSEADLMADPPDPSVRAAVARAEWFVTDYFTADFEPSGSADVRSALPGGSKLPNLPQDGSEGVSYVEWARAYRVEEVGVGLYSVGVVFRTLGAPPDSGFSRQPVRAVEVTVEVTPDGGTTVVDLPAPAVLPLGPEPQPWSDDQEPAPEAVSERGLAEAAAWGTEPRLVASQRTASGWRLVLTVADAVGNRWPLAIAVPVQPTG